MQVATHCPRVIDLDQDHSPTGDNRLEEAANCLDLGQLGHRRTVTAQAG
jgi:hypothetical protein